MTVLITGAAGLVGHVVRTRLGAGGVPVVPVDVRARSDDGFSQVAVDVLDTARLDEIFTATRPSAVVHAGGVSGPMVLPDDPATVIQVNVAGTGNLLETARRHGVSRFVYCSSIAAYGPAAGSPVVEDTPLHPADVYGATKAAGEHLVEAYHRRHGLSTASLRLVTVFGPRRTTDCLIRQLLLDARDGRHTHVPLPADAPQQYVSVDDAADAVLAALEHPEAVGAYNVTGQGVLTVGEVVDAVRTADPRVDAETGPPDPAAADRWPGPLDPAAARRDLGYTARSDFGEAVAAYRVWLDQRPR